VKRNDQAVKVAPSTSGARNGMPEGGGYVYRKGLEPGGWDLMPWAITDDTSTDYDTGLDSRHERKPEANNCCVRCGLDYRNKQHKARCT